MSRTSRCEVIETVFELEAVPELDLVDGLFLAEIEFPPSEARALVVRVGLTAFLVVRVFVAIDGLGSVRVSVAGGLGGLAGGGDVLVAAENLDFGKGQDAFAAGDFDADELNIGGIGLSDEGKENGEKDR